MSRLNLLLLIVFIAFVSAGCETENPLCTENFCVEGVVYPIDELDPDQSYDELEIDDELLLEIIGKNVGNIDITFVRTDEVEVAATMEEVVADVLNGRARYQGLAIIIDAVVSWRSADDLAITVVADDDVDFFIVSPGLEEPLSADILVGTEYTFLIYIWDIERDYDNGGYNIWSDLITDPVEVVDDDEADDF